MSVSRLARFMKGKEGKTAVLVGTVTDDHRLTSDMPKLTVVALRVTDGARARIVKAGGKHCGVVFQLSCISRQLVWLVSEAASFIHFSAVCG